MNTSLRPAAREAEADADRLCALVSEHATALRTGALGRRFQVEDASFRLYAVGRNSIYTVRRRSDWFLKLPRTANAGPIVRESVGAATIQGVLGPDPSYGGAAVIRVSTDPAFVLAATIHGTPLNKAVFTGCWSPWRGPVDDLEQSFRIFGGLAARLNAEARVGPETPPASTRPFERVRRLLERVSTADEVTDAIGTWIGSHGRSDEGQSFVHGNLRLDNVLSVHRRIGLLDFENCGSGSFYQDLSRPVTELLLTRCALAFPRRRATTLLQAFLRAYKQTLAFDPAELWDHVGVRIARYYLETRGHRLFSGRVGGLPVANATLRRFTLDALRHPFQDMAPELGV
jgi:hypothetical protein